MKAKDYLKEYKKQKKIIANCWEEVARWKGVALSITAAIGGERVQAAGSKERMADAVDCYSDIQRDIDQRRARAQAILCEIVETIQTLNEAEYDVLFKTYILEKQFKEIAAEMKKSESWVKSVHGSALQNLQKILDERERQKRD